MLSARRCLALAARGLALSALVYVVVLPGTSDARVDPLYLITRQLQKPNVLIVLDTSSSMGQVPGQVDVDWSEAGVDCDEGDRFCRMVGKAGRCFYSAGGRMGMGVIDDTLACKTDADCNNTAYCSGGGGFYGPQPCLADADCGDYGGGKCKGYCSHNSNLSCNRDSDCGSGKTCQGICSGGTNPSAGYPTVCTTGGNQCPLENPCLAYHIANRNFCAPAGTVATKVKMCRLQQSICRNDADCTAVAGDSCGPASSRLVVAKKVLDQVVSEYYQTLNLGFMTFRNRDYYPYYEMSSVTTETFTAFLSREQLEAQGCFTTSGGPAATCTIHGLLHTRSAGAHARYRINNGTSFSYQFATWGTPAACTNECVIAGVGTGLYVGSNYTYTSYTGTTAGGGWADDAVSNRQTTYKGKMYTASGKTYVYMEPPPTRRNLGEVMQATYDDPIGGGSGSHCTWGSGGLWDVNRWPFMDTSAALSSANATAMMNGISRQLRKANQGGVFPTGGTPTACTLKNGLDGTDPTAEVPEYSAYHYLKKVKTENASNGVSCRPNYILFVTDGYPGGDHGCASNDCRTDPVGAGCSSCVAIAHAMRLRKDLGVKILAVGFSNAVTTGAGRAFLDNLAYVGGTDHAYFADDEDGLRQAVNDALYSALSGSYATSPTTVAGVDQSSTGSVVASMVLDSRADFPTWKGHLIAYDVMGASPVVKWDAATGFDATVDPDFWKKRNVWTSKGKTMIKVQVDAAGTITNAAELLDAGLGATAAEAALVARWMLGDPALKNPAVLGAIVNSSATELGGLGQASVILVGASDGMLHAFHSRDQSIGGYPYYGGREAFAYLPQEMIPVVRRLFAQGGQRPAPKDHIYGLANSPKLKRICIADCSNPGYEVYRTVLVMNDGYGGSDLFMLDVSSIWGSTGARSDPSDPPVQVLWHSRFAVDAASASNYAADLGKTISLPGFYFGKSTGLDDYRMIFASGYTDATNSKQGLVLINARAIDGSIRREDDLRSLVGSCSKAKVDPTEPTVLADVGVARRYANESKDRIAAAYVGDTWGNLFRFVPTTDDAGNITTSGANLSVVDSFGCKSPIHLPPTIVQLDRYDETKSPGHIYVAQLTNSPFDVNTIDVSAQSPASQLIIRREIAQVGNSSINPDSGWVVSPDTDWGDNKDRIALSVTNAGQICAVWNATTKTCTTPMPSGARPISSATGILNSSYMSFALVSLWYVPDAGGCSKGKTYLTIHEVTTTGIFTQKHGELVGDEPVMGAVFAGGKLLVSRSDGARAVNAAGFNMSDPVVPAASSTTYLIDRYRGMGWIEVP